MKPRIKRELKVIKVALESAVANVEKEIESKSTLTWEQYLLGERILPKTANPQKRSLAKPPQHQQQPRAPPKLKNMRPCSAPVSRNNSKLAISTPRAPERAPDDWRLRRQNRISASKRAQSAAKTSSRTSRLVRSEAAPDLSSHRPNPNPNPNPNWRLHQIQALIGK